MRAKFGVVMVLLAGPSQIAWAQQAPPIPPPVTTMAQPPAGMSAPPRPVPHNDPLRPIMATHTMPPYPPESVAAQEQGPTLVEVEINTAGAVDKCSIYKSSGYARLDQAACDHIATNWRWQPPTFHGAPISVRTLISIVWDLKLAQPSQ
jgi:protein TonB